MKARSVWLGVPLLLAALALVPRARAQDREPEPEPQTTPPQAVPDAVPDTSDPNVDNRSDEQRREEMRGEIPRLEDLAPGLDQDAPQIDLPQRPDRPYPTPGDFLKTFREVPPMIPAKPEPPRPDDDASAPDAGS